MAVQSASQIEQSKSSPAPASRITGTGMSVPAREVTNAHFASYLDTSDEWIRDRTGISSRRWAEDGVGVSVLAEAAAREAISNAGLTPADIDGIICATVTPDHLFPSAACIVQAKLGIKRGFAYDINAVCSGFIYALATADGLIRGGLGRNILVIGADLFSKLVDHTDRSTCVLFGDGAGAAVLSAVDGSGTAKGPSGIYGSLLRSDGSYGDILCLPMGSACPPSVQVIEEKKHFVTMAGREVFKLAVRSLCDISVEMLARFGFTTADVDAIVSHQANERILASMAKTLEIPWDKVHTNVAKYGNTSAASVPILLAESVAEGKVAPGDLVLLSAFGGGVTWGALLMRW